MIIKSSRLRLAAAASPLALALSFVLATPASAQTDPAATDPNAPVETAQADTTTQPSATAPSDTTAAQTDQAAPAEGTIVVTGFRAALQNAVNTKKRSDQIVELISAEDIGKLPDASIAESIARLPGLTSQRLSGRSNVISIRGFSPGLLDDPAERPRADFDRRQPRRRISTSIRRKSSARSTSTRRRWRA